MPIHAYDESTHPVLQDCESTLPDSNVSFTYDKPFQYRWTQFALKSTLVDLNTGPNPLQIAGILVIPKTYAYVVPLRP